MTNKPKIEDNASQNQMENQGNGKKVNPWKRLLLSLVILYAIFVVFYNLPFNNLYDRVNIRLNDKGYVEILNMSGSHRIATEPDSFGDDSVWYDLSQSYRLVEFKQFNDGAPYVELRYFSPFIAFSKNVQKHSDNPNNVFGLRKITVYCDLDKLEYKNQPIQ